MRKLRLLFLVSLIVLLMACETTTPTSPTFPNELAPPSLTGDTNSDIIILLVQDIKWRLWAAEVKWISGEISEDEYLKRTSRLLAILEDMEE